MFLEVIGDLFADEQEAIAHGCNCTGLMGSGFAALVADKWASTSMLERYQHLCTTGAFALGDVQAWKPNQGLPTLYNLATQYKPGKNGKLWAIIVSVRLMLDDAEYQGIKRIAIPQIGCGIGGLKWEVVKEELMGLANESSVTLIAYSLGDKT